jgi:UTP-glucose-1-phosphate uridylyltransferase
VVAPHRGLHVEGEIELTHGFAAAMAVPPGVRAVRFGGEIYDCGTPAEYAASVARFPHHELPRAY